MYDETDFRRSGVRLFQLTESRIWDTETFTAQVGARPTDEKRTLLSTKSTCLSRSKVLTTRDSRSSVS